MGGILAAESGFEQVSLSGSGLRLARRAAALAGRAAALARGASAALSWGSTAPTGCSAGLTGRPAGLTRRPGTSSRLSASRARQDNGGRVEAGGDRRAQPKGRETQGGRDTGQQQRVFCSRRAPVISKKAAFALAHR